METLETLNEKIEEQKTSYNIKKKCSVCGVKFKNNWKLYKVKGNLCAECNTRCSNVVANRVTIFEGDIALERKRAKVDQRPIDTEKVGKWSFEALPLLRKEIENLKDSLKEKKVELKLYKELNARLVARVERITKK